LLLLLLRLLHLLLLLQQRLFVVLLVQSGVRNMVFSVEETTATVRPGAHVCNISKRERSEKNERCERRV
jgi:hypothetical protein